MSTAAWPQGYSLNLSCSLLMVYGWFVEVAPMNFTLFRSSNAVCAFIGDQWGLGALAKWKKIIVGLRGCLSYGTFSEIRLLCGISVLGFHLGMMFLHLSVISEGFKRFSEVEESHLGLRIGILFLWNALGHSESRSFGESSMIGCHLVLLLECCLCSCRGRVRVLEV